MVCFIDLIIYCCTSIKVIHLLNSFICYTFVSFLSAVKGRKIINNVELFQYIEGFDIFFAFMVSLTCNFFANKNRYHY